MTVSVCANIFFTYTCTILKGHGDYGDDRIRGKYSLVYDIDSVIYILHAHDCNDAAHFKMYTFSHICSDLEVNHKQFYKI